MPCGCFRIPIREVRPIVQPVPAEETLYMKVAVALCDNCEQPHWLIRERMYIPGDEPPYFMSREPVVIKCCGRVQLIPDSKVYFQLISVEGVPA
jgi:hypothetical protein